MQFSLVSKVALVLALAAGLNPLAGAAESRFLAVRELPVSVRSAADKTVADVSWFLASRDKSGWFAVAGKDAQKRTVEFRCDPEGQNGYFRIDVKHEDLPEVVRRALQAHAPDAQIMRIQTVGLEDGKVMGYRLEANKLRDGQRCIYVSTSGKKVQFAND